MPWILLIPTIIAGVAVGTYGAFLLSRKPVGTRHRSQPARMEPAKGKHHGG